MSNTSNIMANTEVGIDKDISVFAIYCEDDKSLTFYIDTEVPTCLGIYNSKQVTEIYTGFDRFIYRVLNEVPWYSVKHEIKSVIFDQSIKNKLFPISTSYWFHEFTNCESWIGLENLNMSYTSFACGMFTDCLSLTNLDLSCWNMSHIEDISYMFSNCRLLLDLNLSGWGTQSLLNITGIFFGCYALEKIDVSGWDTSHVYDMSCAFLDCLELKEIKGIETWSGHSIKNIHAVFDGCTSLSTFLMNNDSPLYSENILWALPNSDT